MNCNWSIWLDFVGWLAVLLQKWSWVTKKRSHVVIAEQSFVRTDRVTILSHNLTQNTTQCLTAPSIFLKTYRNGPFIILVYSPYPLVPDCHELVIISNHLQIIWYEEQSSQYSYNKKFVTYSFIESYCKGSTKHLYPKGHLCATGSMNFFGNRGIPNSCHRYRTIRQNHKIAENSS